MESRPLLRRLLKAAPPSSTPKSRTSVRPPALWGQAEPVWKAIWNWLRSADDPANRRLQTLDKARRDFAGALADMPTDDACDLRRRGQSARSLRELWHLRAELYSIVARHHSQTEADRRLGLVNRHFPTSTKAAAQAGSRPRQRLDA